jgi:hypothetical protein
VKIKTEARHLGPTPDGINIMREFTMKSGIVIFAVAIFAVVIICQTPAAASDRPASTSSEPGIGRTTKSGSG